MPKLAHIVEAMNASKKPQSTDLIEAVYDSVLQRYTDNAELLRKLLSKMTELATLISAIPETDLTPVLDAIPPATDIKPALKAIEKLTKAIYAIEFPQPEKVDLTADFRQVMQRIDFLSTKIDGIDMSLPEITVQGGKAVDVPAPAPREWVFDIKRGPSGLIREIRAKAV